VTEHSLIKVASDSLGTLMPFLPDTPWTTPTLHVVQQREGDAFVDSPESPRNMVIVAKGQGTREDPHQAFLFGVPTADGLREFVAGVDGGVEFVCDEEMSDLVLEIHPDAERQDSVVCWYDYLEVQTRMPDTTGVRRLRIVDAAALEFLLPPWAFRTYPTAKNLVMGGTVYGVYEEDDLVCAAFTVDHSVKFERVAVVTREDARRKGYAHAALAKLVNGCADRGRIPCCVVPRNNLPAWNLAKKIGFPQTGLRSSWIA
jgi:GNAT superfamily N-acetyltransferase